MGVYFTRILLTGKSGYNTMEPLADRLVDRGVPKQDIVIAYHAPNLRQYAEWALD
jgi:hypothetical protein